MRMGVRIGTLEHQDTAPRAVRDGYRCAWVRGETPLSIEMCISGQPGMVTDAHGYELRGRERGGERWRRKGAGGYEKQQGEEICRRMMKKLQEDDEKTRVQASDVLIF